MSNSNNAIDIFNQDGTVSAYVPFSQRIKAFLEKFPPEQGYRIEVKAADMTAVCGGLKEIYIACLAAGKNPKDAGLPPIPEGIVFRATLIDKEGKEIANATSRQMDLSQYKNYESGETAARQRLYACLGFGGEVFDADEAADMDNQGLKTSQSTSKPKSKPKGKATVAELKPAETAKQEQSAPESERAPEESHPAHVQNSVPGDDDIPVFSDAEEENQQQDSPEPPKALALMLQEIERRAREAGLDDIPQPKTIEEARDELRKLISANR